MYIRLKSQVSYSTVISVYALINPVSSTSEAQKPSEDFYNQLQSVLASIPPTDMVIVLGDFNARVGTDTDTWYTVLGPHGVGNINGNGQRLLDFVPQIVYSSPALGFSTSLYISALGAKMVIAPTLVT